MRVTVLLTIDEVRQIIADALGMPVAAVRMTDKGAALTVTGPVQALAITCMPAQTRRQRKTTAGETLRMIVEDSLVRDGAADDTHASLAAEIPAYRPRREPGNGPAGYKGEKGL